MTHNFISLGKAKALGYNDIYFSFSGLGDNLIFREALEQYYHQTGKKLLAIVDYPDFFKDCDSAYFLKDFNMGVINQLFPFKNDELFIEGMSFKLHFLNGCDIRQTKEGQYFTAWAYKHLIARICERLGMQGKIEINPCLPLSEEEKKFGRFFDKNQIAIIANGIQKYKTWDLNKVQELVNRLKDKYNFIQLGQKSDLKLENVLDKRGVFSMREVAAVLHNSDLFVGSIGGLMHLARFVGCRSVISYSSGEPLELAYYPCNVNILPRNPCSVCVENKLDPQHEVCPFNYKCMDVSVDEMVKGIDKAIQMPKSLETETVELDPMPLPGLEDFYKHKKIVQNHALTVEHKRITLLYILGIPFLKTVRKGRKRTREFFFREKNKVLKT